MIVAVPKEIRSGERRVALIPDACARLTKSGLEVIVQAGAGEASGHSDEKYTGAGAQIEHDARAVYSRADVLVKAGIPAHHDECQAHEADLIREGATLVGFLDPLTDFDLIRKLADRRITAVSMELIPRITRAQSMDALSSMANIAGYKAVLLAAAELPRVFPMMMTAAGTISPAKVFVIGAGVAGLQAIATAKRLGAVVRGYDVRPAVRDQVESLGAKFVELDLKSEQAEDKGGYAKEMGDEFLHKQREMMTKVVAESDVVITTAAIPGKQAPVLITADMVRRMDAGSIIVDLAAERGGNCELTRLDERVEQERVLILGPGNLPSSVPVHASQMYSRNVRTLLEHLVHEAALNLDFEDEITAGSVVTHDGQVVHSRVRDLMGLEPLQTNETESASNEKPADQSASTSTSESS